MLTRVADSCEADKTLSFSSAVNSARPFLRWACSLYTLQFCKVVFPEVSHRCFPQVRLQDVLLDLLRFWDREHSSFISFAWGGFLVLFFFFISFMSFQWSLLAIAWNCETWEVKSVFSLSLQNKTRACKSWCSAQLFIYFLFFYRFFP